MIVNRKNQTLPFNLRPLSLCGPYSGVTTLTYQLSIKPVSGPEYLVNILSSTMHAFASLKEI